MDSDTPISNCIKMQAFLEKFSQAQTIGILSIHLRKSYVKFFEVVIVIPDTFLLLFQGPVLAEVMEQYCYRDSKNQKLISRVQMSSCFQRF